MSSLIRAPDHRESGKQPHLLPPNCSTRIFVKRDDKTGLGLSGNKVRKLEFLLADAVQKGCDCCVTIGGVQSNHCRATAVAARKVGLDSFLILRQSDSELEKAVDPGLTGNLLVARMVNAQLRMVSKSEYIRAGSKALVSQCVAQLESDGRRPYPIPVGGSSPQGAWGYIQCVEEIRQQCLDRGRPFSDIVVACGSGGSSAGLAIGVKLAGLPCKVHAILVCDNVRYFTTHIQDTLTALQLPFAPEDIITLHDGYRGKGYAVSTPQELNIVKDVAAASAVITDPVYTGKALVGMIDLLKASPPVFGDEVLFLHTGGLYGLYDKAEELLPLMPAGQVQRMVVPSAL